MGVLGNSGNCWHCSLTVHDVLSCLQIASSSQAAKSPAAMACSLPSAAPHMEFHGGGRKKSVSAVPKGIAVQQFNKYLKIKSDEA